MKLQRKKNFDNLVITEIAELKSKVLDVTLEKYRYCSISKFM